MFDQLFTHIRKDASDISRHGSSQDSLGSNLYTGLLSAVQPSHPAKLLKTFVAFQVVPAHVARVARATHVNDQRKSFKAPLDGD